MSFHLGNHAERVVPVQQWFIHRKGTDKRLLMCIQLQLEVLLSCSLCTLAHVPLDKASHMAMPVGMCILKRHER